MTARRIILAEWKCPDTKRVYRVLSGQAVQVYDEGERAWRDLCYLPQSPSPKRKKPSTLSKGRIEGSRSTLQALQVPWALAPVWSCRAPVV